MAGVSRPTSISSRRAVRSSAFSEATNVPSFWPTNGDSMSARIWRSLPPSHRPSVSPPTMTSRPLGSARGGDVTQEVPDDADRDHPPERDQNSGRFGAFHKRRAEREGDDQTDDRKWAERLRAQCACRCRCGGRRRCHPSSRSHPEQVICAPRLQVSGAEGIGVEIVVLVLRPIERRYRDGRHQRHRGGRPPLTGSRARRGAMRWRARSSSSDLLAGARPGARPTAYASTRW